MPTIDRYFDRPSIDRYFDRYEQGYRWVVTERPTTLDGRYVRWPRSAQFCDWIHGDSAEAVARAFAADVAMRGWDAAYAALSTD